MKNPIKNNSKQSSKVTIIGSGAWGLAIAELLARNNQKVFVFSQYKTEAENINEQYSHLTFPISSSNNLKLAIKDSDFIFIVVPSNAVLSVLKSLAQEKISHKTRIIICSKGIESKGLQLFSDCVQKELPKNNYAILSGPNFASEVTKLLPTTTNIASEDKKTALEIVDLLKNDNFLPIISSDVVSTQIFGSIKNILAIGCGIIDGLKLGENAKAALVLKGILEASLLIKKLGGKAEKSFISPSGLGDLFLTCSSKKSRNNSLGCLIGSGKNIKEILSSGKTFEGFHASKSMIQFAKKHQITLPLCEKINQILQGQFTTKEIKNIISNAILSN
ncbi:MAG: NAD(P)H-dependent glycerol-3-phosphate dehydrogenase [Pseudomonadota bacterium]